MCRTQRQSRKLMESRLIGDQQRSKAAAWAYVSGDEEGAVTILMSSDSERSTDPGSLLYLALHC